MAQAAVADQIGIAEAAKELSISKRTVQRWCAAGRLDCRRVGVQYVISRRELERLKARPSGHPGAVPDYRKLLPSSWLRTRSGAPMPDIAAIVKSHRAELP